MKTVFWFDLQKSSSCDFERHLFQIKPRWVPFFSNQTTLGAIFASIFRDFAQIFWDFAKVFTDFSLISTKSKLLGVRLHPCPIHH